MATPFSIEFFPPQTAEGLAKLRTTWTALAALGPEFFSVTFGAGGSTRERTLDVVLELKRQGLNAAPHLSCVGSTREQLREIIMRCKAEDIRRIVALRGDLPSGMADLGQFRHANELVEFIRAETGDWFVIEVAAYPEYHPQARSPEDDLRNFQRKVDAGANSAITQYFFNADAYGNFVERVRARGMNIAVVPGIMPIVNFSKLARFSDACGAEIPRWIRRKLESYGDDAESVRAFGLDVVTALCDRLLSMGAPALHFYSMNQAGPTGEILRRLG